MARVKLQCPNCTVTWVDDGGYSDCFCCGLVGEPAHAAVDERRSARDADGPSQRVFLPPNRYRAS